jgi:peptide subunit release factor 1 (eRF1)
MANSIWTTEEFSCPSCGMNYAVTKEEQEDKRSGSFNCRVCETEVHTWSGRYDFFNWEGLRSKVPAFGKKRY